MKRNLFTRISWLRQKCFSLVAWRRLPGYAAEWFRGTLVMDICKSFFCDVNGYTVQKMSGSRWSAITVNVSRWHVMTLPRSRWPLITEERSQWPVITVRASFSPSLTDGSLPRTDITVNGSRWPLITFEGSWWLVITGGMDRQIINLNVLALDD